MTSIGKRKITLKNTEKLLEGIISGKIDKKEARKRFNSIADDANKLNRLELAEPRKKMLPIFKQLQEIFMGTKADDEVDNVTDDKIDDEDNEYGEEIDTTDMPDLESEESAAQRREHEGKGLKILTLQQRLNRLPISLAQLKVGNNSEKLKNERRQLLYLLYRSKKLCKTIYNNLINAI